MSAPDWRNRAECKGKPTAWWFEPPVDRNGRRSRAHEAALRCCERCPVTSECERAGKGEIGTWAGSFRTYKSRHHDWKEEFVADVPRKRYREGSPREYANLVEVFERLVELSVLEYEDVMR